MTKADSDKLKVRVSSELDRPSRLKLMQFVCSFAWADLEVRSGERAFVAELVRKLDLDEFERDLVKAWLEIPPPPEAVDPGLIPREHRKLFLEEIEGVIVSDGEVAPEERENLALLRELLV